MGLAHIGRSVARAVFFYQTQKVVYLESIKLGIIYRTVQLLIIGYIIGFVIIYKKGYQESDEAVSVVTTKVKGLAFANRSDLEADYRMHVWDTVDNVVPPQENGAVFVMTNAIITNGQQQGTCQEKDNRTAIRCTAEENTCREGQQGRHSSGIQTGRCVNGTCEIRAWCPVEYDVLPQPLTNEALINVEEFTIMVKNFIEFRKFGVKRRNIVESINKDHMANCTYDPINDPLCPIFRIRDIVDLAGANWTSLVTEGGIMGIEVNWNCDFDKQESECRPTYSFDRLDDDHANHARGWNFRYANYYRSDNGTLKRDLHKAFGILFALNVKATASKFSIVPLVVNVASGLALLSLASIVCDLILLRVHNKRKFYQEQKFLKITEDEEAAARGNSFTGDHRNSFGDAVKPNSIAMTK